MTKEISSLQAKIISTLPYEKLRDICFTGELTALRGALDCSWDVWRDRAKEELGIPYSFFDLNRNFPHPLTGVERYLTIYSYFHLSPISPVKVYSNGSIEGVYESLAGAIESLKRKSQEGLDIFLPRLTSVGRERLLDTILEYKPSLEELRVLKYFGEDVEEIMPKKKPTQSILRKIKSGDEKAFQYGLATLRGSEKLLIAAVESGKVAFVDAIIKDYFPLPEYFSIEADIPVFPYNETPPPDSIVLPPVHPIQPLGRLVESAAYSCNPQLLDFFMTLYGRRSRSVFELGEGYIFHRNPLGAYSNLLRIRPQYGLDSIWKTGNLDLIYTLFRMVSATNTKAITDIIRYNLGNIPVIIAFSPLFSPLIKRNRVFIAKIRGRYPLTAALLEKEP